MPGMFIAESTQEAMIRAIYSDFAEVYSLCNCGFKTMNLPKDTDLFHDEICPERTTWQWKPLKTTDTTDKFVGFLHLPEHIYYREPHQTSLRCSYCAGAPTDIIHLQCSTKDCYAPAIDLDDGMCEPCKSDWYDPQYEPAPDHYDGPCDCCDGPHA